MASININDYIKYIPEYKVLVCIQHGYCMNPGNGTQTHFRDHHRAIPIGIRKQIIEFSKSVVLSAPDRISMPIWDGKPIDGLKVIENGFRCTFENCEGFVAAAISMMEEHCRKRHDWNKTNGIKWKTQAVQTFFSGIVLKLSLIIQLNIKFIFQLHCLLLKILLCWNL